MLNKRSDIFVVTRVKINHTHYSDSLINAKSKHPLPEFQHYVRHSKVTHLRPKWFYVAQSAPKYNP